MNKDDSRVEDSQYQQPLATAGSNVPVPPVDECDQCGAKRADWQDTETDRCPNHANPYGSCDGTLRKS